MNVRWEHYWVTEELPDGTKVHRTAAVRHRDEMKRATWEQRLMFRARYKQGPPKPDTPEWVYHRERFG